MLGIHRPVRHLVIVGEYLAVVGRVSNARTRPVLGIDEVGALKGFLLVILYRSTLCKLRVELITLWMSYHQVNIWRSKHPLSKRVWHSLRQRTAVRCPRQHSLHALLLLVFLYGDEVGKSLKRVNSGCLHGENRSAGVFHKLVHYGLGIVILPVCQAGKRAYADDVAVTAHHGDSLQQVLRLVAVHYHATLRL